tara:strand:+ start:2502 stop:2726 length:225 start_codon:yes stop_codon:yes gene_type:complete
MSYIPSNLTSQLEMKIVHQGHDRTLPKDDSLLKNVYAFVTGDPFLASVNHTGIIGNNTVFPLRRDGCVAANTEL